MSGRSPAAYGHGEMATYLAEMYMPTTRSGALRDTARKARAATEQMTVEGTPIRYLRTIFLGEDEICFYVYEAGSYEAGSPETVLEASRRAAIPVDRVVEATDIDIESFEEE